MSKGQQTRQDIIEKAAPLFNQRGYAGCSVADILEATGLEKGGLYRHFKSKEELAAESFRYALEGALRQRTAVSSEQGSALGALHELIERFVGTPSPIAGGCPLLNAAVEHDDDGNTALRALVLEGIGDWKERLCVLVRKGRRDGEIRAGVQAEWLADTIIATLEGALMLSRIQRSRTPLRHAQRSLAIILESVKA